jgi:hypothetical protein
MIRDGKKLLKIRWASTLIQIMSRDRLQKPNMNDSKPSLIRPLHKKK